MPRILRKVTQNNAEVAFLFRCPGCKRRHTFWTAGTGPRWQFNGDMEFPTISPSLLVRFSEGSICHSFIQRGMIQFLNDCTHELAGKTVPLPGFTDETETPEVAI